MSSRIILVGGSWGGLRAVRCVLEPLGADLDAGVVDWPSSCKARPPCP